MFIRDGLGASRRGPGPFVRAAFCARRDRLVWAAWAVVALTAFVTLFYYNNGWVQFNAQRFTLDFWPVLLIPLILRQLPESMSFLLKSDRAREIVPIAAAIDPENPPDQDTRFVDRTTRAAGAPIGRATAPRPPVGG